MTLGRALLLVAGVAAAALVAVCALTEPPLRTYAFDADPPPPFEGPLAPNDVLAGCEVFGVGEIDGPEEFELDQEGRLYTGTRDGKILRIEFPDGEAPRIEVFARPGGRPNGLTFDREGRLLVSDEHHGAHLIDPAGRATRLPAIRGQDAAIGRDGRIYFSEAKQLHERTGEPLLDLLLSVAGAAPLGRLWVYDPRTGTPELLVDGLVWPDGVALSRDEDFVVVGEISTYRLTRYWLSGPRAGTHDRLAENLPGMPDGIASDGAGAFYVSIPQLRNDVLDWFHRRPRIKDQMVRLVFWRGFRERLVATPPGGVVGYGLVVVLDERGRIQRSYHEPELALGPGINTAEPYGSELYLGAVRGRGIARCPLGAGSG